MPEVDTKKDDYTYLVIDDELQLRQLQPQDAAAFFELVDTNREYLGRWLPWVETTKERRDSENFISSTLKTRQEGSAFGYGVIYRGNVVGHISLMHITDGQKPEIGYWISSTTAGKGLATKAARKLTQVGLDILNLPEIVIKVQPSNAGSNRVAEKLGYVLLDTLHDDHYGHVVNVWFMKNSSTIENDTALTL
jgi:ribosomal-protein-serine acetyltransferase